MYVSVNRHVVTAKLHSNLYDFKSKDNGRHCLVQNYVWYIKRVMVKGKQIVFTQEQVVS